MRPEGWQKIKDLGHCKEVSLLQVKGDEPEHHELSNT